MLHKKKLQENKTVTIKEVIKQFVNFKGKDTPRHKISITVISEKSHVYLIQMITSHCLCVKKLSQGPWIHQRAQYFSLLKRNTVPEFRHKTIRWAWTNILWPQPWNRSNLPLSWTNKIYFSQGSGSGVKYFLHRQSALSATLFLAQAETAELTAVMSLALMECFVPQCVRMPPGFCASCEGKLGAGAKMADSCPIFQV